MMWRLAFWWRGWRYRRQARHLAGEVGPPYGYVPDQDFYGSMTLAGERGWLPAPEVAHSGWLAQTTADLAPETLEAWGPRGPSESYEEWLAEGQEDRAGTRGWLTSDAPDHRGPGWPVNGADSGPGDLTSLAPGPEPELGPNAARVLARWEERRRERWRLDWDNGAVAA